MIKKIIRNAQIVNEGRSFYGDVLVQNGIIEKIDSSISLPEAATEIDAENLVLIPGCIDDQVHFREPGLTHKANLYTESRAAAAGGITSFMEMPNTQPPVFTQQLLQQKYDLASTSSLVNYSFFMGTSNDNLEELLKTDKKNVCGIKIFMGSSTGNLLVDNEDVLENIFSKVDMLIATHCEDEHTIRSCTEELKQKYGDAADARIHPLVRNHQACYLSSSRTINLAKKHNTRLHILHISTKEETSLFDNTIPLSQKRITAEACIHHLWFSDKDYATKKNFIKWNPSIKTEEDRTAIWQALLDNHIDVLATDHAPHTIDEKNMPYWNAPSGGPLVQHALPAMLHCMQQGKLTLGQVVEKFCHAPAQCFQIEKRGFLREGYFADMVLIDMNKPSTVTRENILYKCNWSPFEGQTFGASVVHTLVNGNLVYSNGNIVEGNTGERLTFNR
ncbi:MAG: dihydroorotase [Bacteroidetes bacterium]|nr:dihydroorotase [Bacteroidota bacterium]